MRLGLGYDIHRLVEDRPLIIGGLEIANDKGLLGHSDADVLVHALMDALLGALNLGDIGKNFPDNDMAYKDISSLKLLERVRELVLDKGYGIVNIDAIIMAERPKLSPYIPSMGERISKVLKIDKDLVSIKATTAEGLGFIGREEGIAAQVIVLLKSLA